MYILYVMMVFPVNHVIQSTFIMSEVCMAKWGLTLSANPCFISGTFTPKLLNIMSHRVSIVFRPVYETVICTYVCYFCGLLFLCIYVWTGLWYKCKYKLWIRTLQTRGKQPTGFLLPSIWTMDYENKTLIENALLDITFWKKI